jgi:hypothetical protein
VTTGSYAQRDVLENTQTGHQREVLMYHADAPAPRVSRLGELHGDTLYEHLTALRANHPGQNVHQGGLAGTVLPHDTVHLPRMAREIGAIEGDEAPEGLAYAPHHDGR